MRPEPPNLTHFLWPTAHLWRDDVAGKLAARPDLRWFTADSALSWADVTAWLDLYGLDLGDAVQSVEVQPEEAA